MSVGDYVRTKDGHIEKIIDKYKATYGYKIVVNEDFKFKHYEHNYIKHIIKSSPNIIDLIEVGDYVNGCYVDEIINSNDSYDDKIHFHLLKFNSYFTNEDIKSIVTHEQFEAIKYEIK